jgi:hypothetical protein
MEMARSTYYFEINKTDAVANRNEELVVAIKDIFGRISVDMVYAEFIKNFKIEDIIQITNEFNA